MSTIYTAQIELKWRLVSRFVETMSQRRAYRAGFYPSMLNKASLVARFTCVGFISPRTLVRGEH